jgi:hypothetical protein
MVHLLDELAQATTCVAVPTENCRCSSRTSVLLAYSLGVLLAQYGTQALHIARDHGQRDIAFEADDAVVRTPIKTVGFQRVNRRFNGRMLLPPQTDEFFIGFALPINRAEPALFRHDHEAHELLKLPPIGRRKRWLREKRYVLDGKVQVDDAYLGGERTGGKAGRGSENKMPFVAAVSLTADDRPLRVRLSPVSGLTLTAIAAWARDYLAPGSTVFSDGPGLLRSRDRGGMHSSTNRRGGTQAEGRARVPVVQHRCRQSQDQLVGLLPCLRLSQVRDALPRGFQLSLQPAL